MNTEKLEYAIKQFVNKIKINTEYYADAQNEREERKEFYQSFTREKLLKMSKDDFYVYIGKLWSMVIWGNKKYIVDKLIEDNEFGTLKKRWCR